MMRSRGPQERRILVLMGGFLVGGAETYDRLLEGRGVDVTVGLRPVRWRVVRMIRRIHLLARFLPFTSLWFGPWKRKDLNSYDLVIIEAADLTLPIGTFLKRRFPRVHSLMWFWNPAGIGNHPEKAIARGLETWTFDEGDAKKYGLRYNSNYSFHELSAMASHKVDGAYEANACYFIGADKGRAPMLSQLATRIASAGGIPRINIVPGVGDSKGDFPLLRTSDVVSYDDILATIGTVGVLLDVPQADSTGLTLRPLEALFLGKKLITSTPAARDSRLYHPSRVLYFEKGTMPSVSELRDFLAGEWTPPSQEVYDYYDFDGWISRFVSGRSE